MSIKILTKFIKHSNPDEEVLRRFDKDLGDIALMTETEIKNRTPVVTGRLKASMVARRIKLLDHEVATNVEYAPYVEYGTSAFGARAMMRRGAAAVEAFGTAVLKETLKKK